MKTGYLYILENTLTRDSRKLARATEIYCAKCCDFSVCLEQ